MLTRTYPRTPVQPEMQTIQMPSRRLTPASALLSLAFALLSLSPVCGPSSRRDAEIAQRNATQQKDLASQLTKKLDVCARPPQLNLCHPFTRATSRAPTRTRALSRCEERANGPPQAVSKANKTLEREVARIHSSRELTHSTETQTDADSLLLTAESGAASARASLAVAERKAVEVEQGASAAAAEHQRAREEALRVQGGLEQTLEAVSSERDRMRERLSELDGEVRRREEEGKERAGALDSLRQHSAKVLADACAERDQLRDERDEAQAEIRKLQVMYRPLISTS